MTTNANPLDLRHVRTYERQLEFKAAFWDMILNATDDHVEAFLDDLMRYAMARNALHVDAEREARLAHSVAYYQRKFADALRRVPESDLIYDNVHFWNQQHPVGTPVQAVIDGQIIDTETVSKAKSENGVSVVRVAACDGAVPLRSVVAMEMNK